MKVTRYFQSCLLIEEGNTRILIDPSGHETERAADLGKLDAVIYTHEHADHFDADLAQKFAEKSIPIYANESTAKQMKSQPNIVSDGQEFEVGGIKIQAKELPHCLMIDGSPGPQNTGYLIDSLLFHPGDGTELADLKVDNLAVPISGPDVSFKDACSFLNRAGAKLAIPIHYDFVGTKPEAFKNFSGIFNQKYEVRPLDVGQSTEL